jgi:transposase
MTWGEVPEEHRGRFFGPRLTALMAALSGRCHLSKRLTVEMLEWMGVKVSPGTVCNLEREIAQALEGPWEEALEEVRQAPVKNVDESGWFLTGALKWLWAVVTEKVAVFKIHDRRNQKAMKDLLGEKAQGIVGSDRYGAYTPIPLGQRQLCWAHLIRDFRGLVEGGTKEGIRIGKAGLRLAEEVFRQWRKFKEGKMKRRRLLEHMERFQYRMEKILKRGREGKDPKVRRFCGRVLKLQQALWTFAREEGVEPTNNAAERAIRPAVLWRKGSYGNRSDQGCRFTERILTVVQTLRIQKRNVLDYLTQVVLAARLGQPCPSLVQ